MKRISINHLSGRRFVIINGNWKTLTILGFVLKYCPYMTASIDTHPHTILFLLVFGARSSTARPEYTNLYNIFCWSYDFFSTWVEVSWYKIAEWMWNGFLFACVYIVLLKSVMNGRTSILVLISNSNVFDHY